MNREKRVVVSLRIELKRNEICICQIRRHHRRRRKRRLKCSCAWRMNRRIRLCRFYANVGRFSFSMAAIQRWLCGLLLSTALCTNRITGNNNSPTCSSARRCVAFISQSSSSSSSFPCEGNEQKKNTKQLKKMLKWLDRARRRQL